MSKLFVSNNDETVNIFKNDFVEKFSRTHWTVPLIIFIPVIIFYLYNSYINLNVAYIFLLFISGIFIWTLVEYSLHRFIFHYHPVSETGKKIHWTFHGVHHDYPQDSKRLVMVPAVSIPLAIFFYFLFKLIFTGNYVDPAFAGLLVGYLIYDISHYAFHHFAIKNKFFLRLKQHHMKHHYSNPDVGFGVSSRFWDKIFNTNFK